MLIEVEPTNLVISSSASIRLAFSSFSAFLTRLEIPRYHSLRHHDISMQTHYRLCTSTYRTRAVHFASSSVRSPYFVILISLTRILLLRLLPCQLHVHFEGVDLPLQFRILPREKVEFFEHNRLVVYERAESWKVERKKHGKSSLRHGV